MLLLNAPEKGNDGALIGLPIVREDNPLLLLPPGERIELPVITCVMLTVMHTY